MCQRMHQPSAIALKPFERNMAVKTRSVVLAPLCASPLCRPQNFAGVRPTAVACNEGRCQPQGHSCCWPGDFCEIGSGESIHTFGRHHMCSGTEVSAIAGFLLTEVACHSGDNENVAQDASVGVSQPAMLPCLSHLALPSVRPVWPSKWRYAVNQKHQENSEVAGKRLPSHGAVRPVSHESQIVSDGRKGCPFPNFWEGRMSFSFSRL